MNRLRKQSLHSAPRKVPASTHTHSQYTLSSNFTTTSQCSNYRQMYRDDSAAIDQHNGAYLLADARTMCGLTVSLIVLMSWMTDARWVTRQWQRVVLLWQRANWQVSSVGDARAALDTRHDRSFVLIDRQSKGLFANVLNYFIDCLTQDVWDSV